MGHISILSSLFPYRFSLNKRLEPVELKLEITNTHHEPIMLSVSLALPNGFGFDRTGLTKDLMRRYEKIRPGETVNIIRDLYLGKILDEGEWNARVIVDEHFNEFGTIMNTYKKSIDLRVVK